MGLFDQIAGMAGGMTGGGGQPGEGGAGGGAVPGGVAAAVAQMLQSQGGVAGVLAKFHQSGLGGLASSWTGQGANAPVAPDQVQTALGSGPIAEVAQKLGISPDMAAGHISQLLPQIMDHLTPGGQVPEGGGMGGLTGLISQLRGGAAPA